MATGSRSVSDFTRNAVIRQSKLSAAPRGLLSDDLATIGRELYELDGELRRLCDRIQRVMGTEEQVTAAESRQPAYSFKAQSSS